MKYISKHKKKVKINPTHISFLMISPLIYPHHTGGLELFNFHLACETSRRGNDVHLLTRKLLPGIESIKIHRFFTRSWLVDALQTLLFCSFNSHVQAMHIPYTSNSNLVYPINLLPHRRQIPHVVYIHGGGMHPWKDPAASRRFFHSASAVMAVSKRLQKEYAQRIDRPVEYIPPMIPFQMPVTGKVKLRLCLGFGPSDLIFLVVGSIKEIKGSDFLVRTILSMERGFLGHYHLRFVFLGDGPLRKPLEQEISSAGLQAHVIFKGLIPHEKVGDYFKAADVFLIPSKFEGTPLALLEALFHGLPAIGSDVEGINDILDDGHTGLLFKPFDSVALVEKIISLIQAPGLRKRLGQTGRQLFDAEYSFNRVMDRHLAVLQAAAESGTKMADSQCPV